MDVLVLLLFQTDIYCLTIKLLADQVTAEDLELLGIQQAVILVCHSCLCTDSTF